MSKVYIDFETRSELDLTEIGSALYAEHPSTDVMCIGFQRTTPLMITDRMLASDETSEEEHVLYEFANDPNTIFVAHNAIFEQRIWEEVMVKKHGFPSLPIYRWRCTMAKAYANGLPGGLKKAAKVMQLPIQKDLEGRETTLSLSKPKPKRKMTLLNIKTYAKEAGIDVTGIKKDNWHEFGQRPEIAELFTKVRFWTEEEKPEKFQRMYEYCSDDVAICKLIDERLPDLDPVEEATWHFDQKMNRHGLYIDRPVVEKVVSLVDEHNKLMLNEFKSLTGLNSPRQRDKLKEWFKENGIDIENTQKGTIAGIETESETVRRAIEITKELSKSSVAKYYTMLEMSTQEGLIREIDQYHAAHTGRYGGRGVQFQNLPRAVPLMPIEDIVNHSYQELLVKYPDLMMCLSSVLRQMIIPRPGHEFIIGDFSQMEHRVQAWLAGEESVLETYRQGKDPYSIEATGIFGYEVDKSMKQERQVGKVAILAMQYAGGIGAFGNMAKGYDLDLHPVADQIWNSATEKEQNNAMKSYQDYLSMAEEPLDEAEGLTADIIKQRWRRNNPNICKFWKWLEKHARGALGSEPIFGSKWQLYGDYLVCWLPSGRPMVYPYPNVEFDGQLSYYSESVKAKKTNFREYTHGGKLSENITQAVQRDLLRDAMLNMVAEYRDPIFHVHDEIVCESPNAQEEKPKFESIMKRPNPWAPGLPIDVDAFIAKRYKK